MKRLKRRKIKKIFIFLIFLFMISFFISSAYSYLSQRIGIEGNATVNKTTDSDQCLGNIEYEINSWINNNKYYYRIVFTITNNSSKNYNGWTVYFDVPDDSTLEAYSSTEASLINNKIKATNVYYNSNINSYDSFQFEIQFSTESSNYEPTNITLANCFSNNESSDTIENLEVKFELNSSYGTYTYIYNVVVKNIGIDVIKNWTISIVNSNISLNDAWNANYIVKNDAIVFSNKTYNGTINPGDSVVFGIVISTDDPKYVPSLVGEL